MKVSKSSKQQMWHLIAIEAFIRKSQESSGEEPLELQQLPSQQHVLRGGACNGSKITYTVISPENMGGGRGITASRA